MTDGRFTTQKKLHGFAEPGSGMSGRTMMNRFPKRLRPNMREDIQTQKESFAPEQHHEHKIEHQQSLIGQRTAAAPVQFIDMLLA